MSAQVDAEVEEVPGDGTAGDGETVPVGVKLGSTRTVIALLTEDGSAIRTVRTLTCLASYKDLLTGEERYLYGEEAATEYPDRVQFMLRSGPPADGDRAELTEQFFTALIDSYDIPEDSAVVYAIPTIDNPEGLANLQNVIEEIFLAINMESTNLEASAYRRGEQIAPSTTGTITGNEVDRVIASYVEEFETRVREALGRDVETVTADRPDLAATIGAQRIAARLA